LEAAPEADQGSDESVVGAWWLWAIICFSILIVALIVGVLAARHRRSTEEETAIEKEDWEATTESMTIQADFGSAEFANPLRDSDIPDIDEDMDEAEPLVADGSKPDLGINLEAS
jgi:hypothetical protein